MEWRKRKNTLETEIQPSGIGYTIAARRDHTICVQGRRVGGADAQLPWNSHATVDDAKAWVEAYEERQIEWIERNKRNRIVL